MGCCLSRVRWVSRHWCQATLLPLVALAFPTDPAAKKGTTLQEQAITTAVLGAPPDELSVCLLEREQRVSSRVGPALKGSTRDTRKKEKSEREAPPPGRAALRAAAPCLHESPTI